MTYYTISTERWKFIVGFQAHFYMYFITDKQDYFVTTIRKANFWWCVIYRRLHIMSKAIPISMLEFGERIDLCLCCERGGGGGGGEVGSGCWYVGVMQNRESPDFRSLQISKSASRITFISYIKSYEKGCLCVTYNVLIQAFRFTCVTCMSI